MATPGQLIATLSESLGLPERSVAWTYRLLREAGQVSKNGRGKAAAQVTAADAAMLLIACPGHLPMLGRVEAARVFAMLKPKAGFSMDGPVLGGGPGAWRTMSKVFPVLGALPDDHNVKDAVSALVTEAGKAPLVDILRKAFGRPGDRIEAAVSISFSSPNPLVDIAVDVKRAGAGEELEVAAIEGRVYFDRQTGGGGQPLEQEALRQTTTISTPALQRLGDLIAEQDG